VGDPAEGAGADGVEQLGTMPFHVLDSALHEMGYLTFI
jgi:hypothetical protein